MEERGDSIISVFPSKNILFELCWLLEFRTGREEASEILLVGPVLVLADNGEVLLAALAMIRTSAHALKEKKILEFQNNFDLRRCFDFLRENMVTL
jgi:hypothetical protein